MHNKNRTNKRHGDSATAAAAAYLSDRRAVFHHRREIFRVQLVDVHVCDEKGSVSGLGKAIRLSTASSSHIKTTA